MCISLVDAVAVELRLCCCCCVQRLLVLLLLSTHHQHHQLVLHLMLMRMQAEAQPNTAIHDDRGQRGGVRGCVGVVCGMSRFAWVLVGDRACCACRCVCVEVVVVVDVKQERRSCAFSRAWGTPV